MKKRVAELERIVAELQSENKQLQGRIWQLEMREPAQPYWVAPWTPWFQPPYPGEGTVTWGDSAGGADYERMQ